MSERLNSTLQENLLVLLAYDDQHGKLVAQIARPELFEGDYRVIAERCIEYWKQQREAPKVHTPDLFADILEDKGNRRARFFTRTLDAMLDLSLGINTKYVTDQLRKFTRLQELKAAIYESAEIVTQQQEVAIPQIEAIWDRLLRANTATFESGLTLSSFDQLLTYMEQQYNEFLTGVSVLDRKYIVPSRGTSYLFLAPAGFGKTWFLISVGVQAVLMRKRILHISLEMSEEQVLQRYYQMLFAVSKRDEKATVATVDMSETRTLQLAHLETEEVDPTFSFESKVLRDELMTHVNALGPKAEYLRIKRFPTRGVTIADIEGYLDMLEVTEGFIPDMIVLDYIGITKTDERNHRISLGRAYETWRGMCVRRNVAGVTAHQTSKTSATARVVESIHVSEDWSMVATSDVIVAYSQTKAEKKYGLARLYVCKARDDQDGFGVLVTQSYAIGQFAVASYQLPSNYFDKIKEYTDDDDSTAESSEADDDD